MGPQLLHVKFHAEWSIRSMMLAHQSQNRRRGRRATYSKHSIRQQKHRLFADYLEQARIEL
jgi:hypothetical protein